MSMLRIEVRLLGLSRNTRLIEAESLPGMVGYAQGAGLCKSGLRHK